MSGGALAVIQLRQFDALWTTDYGRVLCAKLVAVFALIDLAAVNRYGLTPRVGAATGHGGAAAGPVDRDWSWPSSRRAWPRCELALHAAAPLVDRRGQGDRACAHP